MQALLKDLEEIDMGIFMIYYSTITKQGLSLTQALHRDSLTRAAEVVGENEKQKRNHLSIVA